MSENTHSRLKPDHELLFVVIIGFETVHVDGPNINSSMIRAGKTTLRDFKSAEEITGRASHVKIEVGISRAEIGLHPVIEIAIDEC